MLYTTYGLRVKEDFPQDLFKITEVSSKIITEEFFKQCEEIVGDALVKETDKERGEILFSDLYISMMRTWKEDLHHTLGTKIYYSQSNDNERILAMPVGQTRYYNALLKSGIYEKYGYWDNADKPSKISTKEWKKRQEDWGEISHNPNWGVYPLITIEEPTNPFKRLMVENYRSAIPVSITPTLSTREREKGLYYRGFLKLTGDYALSEKLSTEFLRERGGVGVPELKFEVASLPPLLLPWKEMQKAVENSRK